MSVLLSVYISPAIRSSLGLTAFQSLFPVNSLSSMSELRTRVSSRLDFPAEFPYLFLHPADHAIKLFPLVLENFPLADADSPPLLILTRVSPHELSDWKESKAEIPSENRGKKETPMAIKEEPKWTNWNHQQSRRRSTSLLTVAARDSLSVSGRVSTAENPLSYAGKSAFSNKSLRPATFAMAESEFENEFSDGEKEKTDKLKELSDDENDELNEFGEMQLFDPAIIDTRSSSSSLLDYLTLIGVLNEFQCAELTQAFHYRGISSVAAVTELKSKSIDGIEECSRGTKNILKRIIKLLMQNSDQAETAKPEEESDSSSSPFDENYRSRNVSGLLTRQRSSRADLLNSVEASADADEHGDSDSDSNSVNDSSESINSPVNFDDPTLVAFPVSRTRNGVVINRVLCINWNEIWVCKGSKLRSSFPLSDVFCVTLQDSNNFSLSFINDRDLVFSSPESMKILQEINEKLAARKSQEKTAIANRLKQPSNVENYQQQMHRESQSRSFSSEVNTNNSNEPSTKEEAKSPTQTAANAKRQPNKVEQLTGSSESQLIESSVQHLITDKATDEGRARLKFLKSIQLMKKNPKTALATIRQFMDSLLVFMKRKRFESLNKLAPKLNEEEIIKLIERGIESAIVAPLYEKIGETIKIGEKKSEENCEEMIQSSFKEFSQTWFGIATPLQSAHNWSESVRQLSLADRKFLPVDKLDCILNAARSIYGDISARIFPPRPLSADDFFPIFVFVLSRSTIKSPEQTKQFCWELCSKDALNGEGGYYLTVFEAAIEFLKAEKIKLKKPDSNTNTTANAATSGNEELNSEKKI